MVGKELRELTLHAAALAALLAAGGAGAQVAPKEAVDLKLPPGEAAAFRLEDRRPAAERVTREERVFNLWVVEIGDDLVRPAPPQALRAWLQNRLAAQLQGGEIILLGLRAELEIQDTSVHFQAVGGHGAGLVAHVVGNLIAKSIIEAGAAGRTDNILRFRAHGTVGGAPFAAELTRRYTGRAFGDEFVSAFTAALEEAGVTIQRAVERD